MAVTIDSGPIEAEFLLRHVPEKKWRELMLARRRFLEIQLSYDCRCLVQFVNDARLMFEALGFQSLEHMIRDGYGLEPAEIELAIEWLKLNPPNKPVSLDYAVTQALGQRGAPAGNQNAAKNKGSNATFVPELKKNRGASYILARLDRDGHAEH
jgi:hypothetical protein